MNIFLFGISNVGKTTTGRLLAQELGYRFFDTDEEVKSRYHTKLEHFVNTVSHYERDQIRGEILGDILALQQNTVVAVTPMCYSIWFNKYLKRDDVLAIELQDTPESVFDRLVFSDENDRVYRDDKYRDAHAAYYLKDIKKDITFYKRSFSKITNKYQMNHRSPEEVVKGLIETYGLLGNKKTELSAEPQDKKGKKEEKNMRMERIYTLKVYPAGMSRSVYRVIEISGSDTLDQLCGAILDSYDFIDEHLYEFCMDNRMYSDNAYQSDPEDDEPSTKVALDKLHLEKGQNFSLHYDFGDDWMFTIHVQKIDEAAAYKEAKVIREKGAVEQYPEWDEEE